MRPEPNHYSSLNLKEDATDDEIRRAYRRRVKESHPDATGRQEETDSFRAAREAYEVLGNPERRREYDERGKGSAPGSASPPAASGHRETMHSGPDADIELILSPEEAERGGRFRIPLNGGGCPFCDRFGSIFGGTCPFCGGTRGDVVLELQPGVSDGTVLQLVEGRGARGVRILVSVRRL